MKLTGIKQLDELVSPLCKHWVVDFYGDPGVTLKLMHYLIAYRSSSERVYLLLNLEFGGLDTLYLVRLCRLFNCNMDNIMVSRSFRFSETLEALEEVGSTAENALVVLVYPYSYIPKGVEGYAEASRITGLILRASASNQVVVFNTVTRLGRYMPEGGSFHHHVVKVMVRLTRLDNSILAELVKHPVKEKARRVIPVTLLEHPVQVHSSKTILEWARSSCKHRALHHGVSPCLFEARVPSYLT